MVAQNVQRINLKHSHDVFVKLKGHKILVAI